MVGDLLLGFIVACMAILVGYPLLKLAIVSYRSHQARRLCVDRASAEQLAAKRL